MLSNTCLNGRQIRLFRPRKSIIFGVLVLMLVGLAGCNKSPRIYVSPTTKTTIGELIDALNACENELDECVKLCDEI